MKREIPVEELQFGMYVSKLDRPWTDTPFMFQGFELKTQKELDELKKYCKTVFVDTDKGLDLPDPVRVKPKPAGKSGNVLETITHKVDYVERASLQAELPHARAAHGKAEVVLNDMFDSIRAGKTLDAPRVREAVTSMTESVVRNPDAMLLLTKLKEKEAQAAGRAVGISVYMITFARFLHLPLEQLELLGMLGLLQDVGMMRLPPAVLDREEPLKGANLEAYKKHVEHSVALLKETTGLPTELPGLTALHHERFDGSGYPKGLKGEQIGLFGSIAGVIDHFDELMQPKPFGGALAPSNALSVLYQSRDRLFSGPLVEQFIQCIGIYPVGAIVELNSGEIGIVIAQNLARRLLPRVMVVLDAKGSPVRPQKILDLAKDPKVTPDTPYRIKRTMERDSVSIDPAEFFI